MKCAQLLLKSGLLIQRSFEEDNCFACGFDFVLPTIDGVNSRNDIGTCCELVRN